MDLQQSVILADSCNILSQLGNRPAGQHQRHVGASVGPGRLTMWHRC